jgi:hypothetical protein
MVVLLDRDLGVKFTVRLWNPHGGYRLERTPIATYADDPVWVGCCREQNAEPLGNFAVRHKLLY